MFWWLRSGLYIKIPPEVSLWRNLFCNLPRKPITRQRVFFVNGVVVAQMAAAHRNGPVGHAVEVFFADAAFVQGGGQSQRTIEAFQPCNAFRSNGFVLTKIFRNVKDTNGKLGKSCRICFINITSPTSPYSTKSCAVSHIKHTAKFMLNFMRSKI